ncbi:hypothetical protein BDV38DRAFT_282788 [Aspergillus pseudotamarii]|uniref:Uncharacterized protein n=1 Tax=Aspergillus pseudotamarii TaxID=132259 RepID=A0A5N6SSD0_ASPPS|nr:uncharacterized protein BDV38DRAFT_282788 [Aspergillus pseudotamarii]KAE8137535.1 hypothetical protein BDV38DRAFT_282788 [Aspergillus pseudotamarii]
MRNFKSFLLLAALSGAYARNCWSGLVYCGWDLLKIGNYEEDIEDALELAGQPINAHTKRDSLFFCGGPDDLSYQGTCHRGECQWNNNNDYCNGDYDIAPTLQFSTGEASLLRSQGH